MHSRKADNKTTIKTAAFATALFVVFSFAYFPRFSHRVQAANTAAFTAGANAAKTTGAGDNNGLEISPTATAALDGTFAQSANTGTGNATDGCTTFNQSEDDAHDFYNFNISVPAGSTINGIQADTNGKWSTNSGTNQFCIGLSWNAGSSWTSAQGTGDLQTSAASTVEGGSTDTWGRTWAVSELSNTNFRVRVMIDPGAANTTTAYLDYIGVTVYYTPPATTLGDGSNPDSVTIAPGSSATDLDSFTLQTITGTDTVTALAAAVSTTTGISQLDITDSGNVAQCSAVTDPASTVINFSGCSLAVTTSPATYKIRVTPKTHADMPPVPGGLYAITGTITSFTSTNTAAGSDSASATVTIDNASPSDVTGASTLAGSGQIAVTWANPTDADFSQVIILRSTSSISSILTEGISYSAGSTTGASTVVYAGSGTSYTDSGLTDGVTYYYKLFVKDVNENYSTPGIEVSSVPIAPFYLSGHIFGTDGATPLLVADSVSLAIASSTNYSTTSLASDGSFYFIGMSAPASGTLVTLWLNTNGGDQGSVVFKYGSNCTSFPSCSGLKIYRDHVRINSFNGASMDNADLSQCDNDNGSACSDADIGFASNGATLTVTFPILRIAPTATFSPGGNVSTEKLQVAGTYSGGSETLILSGSGESYDCATDQAMPLCVLGTFASSSNTVQFTGNATTAVASLTYYNLYINSASGTPVFVIGTSSATTTVSNNFSIGGSGTTTVDAITNNPILVIGNFTIGNKGAFLAPSSSPLVVMGNFTNSGTFENNNGTVTLSPAGTSVVSGSTTFYNLKSVGPGTTIKFESQTGGSPVFTVTGLLMLNGDSNNNINIQSDSPGNQWLLNLTTNPSVLYASLTDSGCTGNSAAVNLSSNVINGGNNGGCWIFYIPAGGGGSTIIIPTPPVGVGSGGGTLVSGGADSGDGSGGVDPIGVGNGGGAVVSGGSIGGDSNGGSVDAAP